MKERILSINPNARVKTHQSFYTVDNADGLIENDYDYVVDAIDTISAKIDLAVRCKAREIPIIASMGAGNKLDPTAFRVGDIFSTSVDPIARVMRRELKSRGVKGLKVVFSTERPIKPKASQINEGCKKDHIKVSKRSIPGSVSFVPSVVGLVIGGEVIKDIIGWT